MFKNLFLHYTKPFIPKPKEIKAFIPTVEAYSVEKNTNELKEKIKVELKDIDLREKFVKGGGPGGQKINKSSNCVQLLHIPTGITVETQRFRELCNNRKEARKLLSLKLDLLYNGNQSKIALNIEKKKKKKANKRRKALKKYGNPQDKKESTTDAKSIENQIQSKPNLLDSDAAHETRDNDQTTVKNQVFTNEYK